MKKQFIGFLIAGIFTTFGIQSQAQSSPNNRSEIPPANDLAIGKPAEHVGSVGTTLNKRALKEFNRDFKTDSRVFWNNDGRFITAKFSEGEVHTKVMYNRHGLWLGTVKTYMEAQLPRDVRTQVKREYFDYNIFGVIEVSTPAGKAYLVRIEDAKTWKTIRVRDGEMDVYESYTKF